MPRRGEQRKIGDFFSSSPVKTTKSNQKDKTKVKQSPAKDVIDIDESEDGWDTDTRQSKLAPSSPIKSQAEHDRSESDDAPIELSPVAKRRRQKAAAHIISDVDTSGSDDHVPLNIVKKRKVIVLDDSDDELLQSPSKKRKVLKKGLKPLNEEENLMDELDSDVVLKTRLRAPVKKSAHGKALEKLKRVRRGLSPKPSSNSSQESSGEADSESTTSDKGFKPIPGAQKPGGSRASASDDGSESADSDIESFVVVDEEDAEVTLPAEYSAQRAQPLGLSFKVFFQFLVHTACQPPHMREIHMKTRLEGDKADAQYWRNAVAHLRRTLGSIRDSQVASTIWKAEFRQALEKFPEIDIKIIPVDPYCHACRRTVALSTRQAILEGEAYNREGFGTLEESLDDEGSSDDENDSDPEEDAVTTFNLGQHCARRVELFHAFMHWEYHLFKAIEDEIAALETSNRENLLGKKKKKKKHLIDTENPDAIVELLEARKVIDTHWKQIQNMMERAKRVEMRQPGEVD